MCAAQHVAVESIIFRLLPISIDWLATTTHQFQTWTFFFSSCCRCFSLLSLGKDLVYKQIKSSTCLLVNLDKSFYPFFLACKDFLFYISSACKPLATHRIIEIRRERRITRLKGNKLMSLLITICFLWDAKGKKLFSSFSKRCYEGEAWKWKFKIISHEGVIYKWRFTTKRVFTELLADLDHPYIPQQSKLEKLGNFEATQSLLDAIYHENPL